MRLEILVFLVRSDEETEKKCCAIIWFCVIDEDETKRPWVEFERKVKYKNRKEKKSFVELVKNLMLKRDREFIQKNSFYFIFKSGWCFFDHNKTIENRQNFKTYF